jgi:hypothetical protein
MKVSVGVKIFGVVAAENLIQPEMTPELANRVIIGEQCWDWSNCWFIG